VTDLAGNQWDSYAPDEFTVDTVQPEITFSGVEDRSANNDEVRPIVTMSDINYDMEGVDIRLAGANCGTVQNQGGFAASDNGQVFTFADFERVRASDDLYTLTVSVTDMAGNMFEDSMQFSVNRFGSIFVVEHEATRGLMGSFMRESQDVQLREINVDEVLPDSVDINVAKDGSVRKLSVGDYSVSPDADSAYASWYIYDYNIPAEQFAADGNYVVTIKTDDTAGNINENTDPNKIAEGASAEVDFAVDGTAPVIAVSDLVTGGIYNSVGKDIVATIRDNLLLGSVALTVNSQPAEMSENGEVYTFPLSESNSRQSAEIIATDAAGNETVWKAEDFILTTNAVVRWFYNTPLFIGTVAGVLVLGGGGASVTVLFRRGRIKFPTLGKKA
jgi:hypothetical protein